MGRILRCASAGNEAQNADCVVTLEPGEYKLAVYTRCGDSDESVGVKSASRQVTVKAAE